MKLQTDPSAYIDVLKKLKHCSIIIGFEISIATHFSGYFNMKEVSMLQCQYAFHIFGAQGHISCSAQDALERTQSLVAPDALLQQIG